MYVEMLCAALLLSESGFIPCVLQSYATLTEGLFVTEPRGLTH